MATQNQILKERAELVRKIKDIQSLQGKEAAKLDATYIKLKARLQDILKLERKSLDNTREQLSGMYALKDTVGSLSTVYRKIKNEVSNQITHHASIAQSVSIQRDSQKELTATQKTQAGVVDSVLKKYEEQSSLAVELAQLTAEDQVDKARILDDMQSIQQVLESEVATLDKRTSIAKDFLSMQGDLESSLKSQKKEAESLASISAHTKDILEEQISAIDAMKSKFNALGSTLTTFLQRPQAAVGAIIGAIGHWEHKVTDVNKELGFTLLDMNSAAKSAGLLSFIFDDTAGTIKALTSEFGNIEKATLTTQFRVGAMASLMGISNTEAAQLTGHFARMNGGSTNIAADMIQTTKEYAKQNNVIPSDVLSDLAGSAEEFALFAKDGGKNMIKAATGARMLGTDLKTVSGIAEGLLDFESSMTNELELSAMLGRNINLGKARQLAYDGKIAEAAAETLKQVGGIEAFNKMDYYQKKQTADLLGVSVAEMQKMAENQKNIGSMGSVVNKTFSDLGAGLNMITNKFLGTGIEMLGGWVATSAKFGANMAQMGMPLGGIIKGTGQILRNLLQMTSAKLMTGLSKIGSVIGGSTIGRGAGKFKDSLLKGVGSKSTPSIGKNTGGGLSSIANGIEKINPAKLIAGAAALVIAAGAVWVLGKGLQEFKGIGLNELGLMAGGITILALALAGLSILSGPILIGAAALLVAAGAVWVLGKGLQEMSTGIASIASISPVMSSLISQIGGIVSLSAAFMGLAGSIGALGLASLLAMPALMGLGAVGAGIAVVSNLFNSSNTSLNNEAISTYENKMLTKMEELIASVKENRDVYLDREKVSTIIRKTNDRQTSNSGFGLAGA